MMRRTLEKLKSDAGASLTEVLVTVLLMSLVTLAIASGIAAAVRVYRQVSTKAEAQTLLGTSIAALNNDFAYADTTASDFDQTNAGSFYSQQRGYDVHIQSGGSRGILVTDGENAIPLVTDKTMTSGLYTEISDISYDDSDHCFTYKITVNKDGETTPIETQTVKVRNIVSSVN